MNELNKEYIKYDQLNIKNNIEITKINNIEENNKVDFYQSKELTPYCNTTYDIFKPNTNIIVPYNEFLLIKDYCNY
jgi:hypothetical protein